MPFAIDQSPDRGCAPPGDISGGTTYDCDGGAAAIVAGGGGATSRNRVGERGVGNERRPGDVADRANERVDRYAASPNALNQEFRGYGADRLADRIPDVPQ